MGKDELPETIRRDFEKAQKSGKNKVWDATILTLTTLSAAAFTYHAYRRLRGNLEPEDPIADFINKATRLKKAGENPREIFFELPEGRKRTRLVVAAFQHLAPNHWELRLPDRPLLYRASEYGPFGGIYLQEVTIGEAPTRSGRTRQSTLYAICGEANLFKPLDPLDPNRRQRIEEAVSRYSIGLSAIEARRRLTTS